MFHYASNSVIQDLSPTGDLSFRKGYQIGNSLQDENLSITWLYYLNSNRYIFAVSELPNFLTRDSLTLTITLSILHSPRSLAAEPIQNAENMESILAIGNQIEP